MTELTVTRSPFLARAPVGERPPLAELLLVDGAEDRRWMSSADVLIGRTDAVDRVDEALAAAYRRAPGCVVAALHCTGSPGTGLIGVPGQGGLPLLPLDPARPIGAGLTWYAAAVYARISQGHSLAELAAARITEVRACPSCDGTYGRQVSLASRVRSRQRWP